ncbi:c6 zinc finger domain-containing protein [Xylariales sp. PMI_506]|nr:c6 zinc finger domain-containing protein [Xylariales sp. PMI_506]
MQSFLQHRRILAAVKADLANSSPRSPMSRSQSGTPTSNSHEGAADPQLAQESDQEKGKSESPTNVPGVTVLGPSEEDGSLVYLVGWKPDDPLNPQNWSTYRKWTCIGAVLLLTIALTIPASIDAPVAAEFNEHFGVSAIAGSLTTGMFLIGTGVGSLFAGTVSETLGRNTVYFTTFLAFLLCMLGKALAPTFGGALVLRFLAGLFGSTPMTAAGGTMADLCGPLDLVFAVPLSSIFAYAGPLLGPIVGAYLPALGFRWADWMTLIIGGTVFVYILILQPETYAPVLLEWRASHLRALTGDDRYRAREGHPGVRDLGRRLILNIYRPFVMTYTEPIILVFALYLTIIYFVLFTFLGGYPFIFEQTYGISQSLTYLLWVALLVGDLLALPLIPIIHGWAKKAAAAGTLTPEICLWYSMLGGSIMMPISLWWMAWTCFPDINIWVPIVGSVFFGYGLITIFTTTLLYTVFVYGVNSASALAFMVCVRYTISGALVPASVPMYENLGPHKALTIPAVLASLMAPVPFLLYKYGPKLRSMSKSAMH